MQQGRSTVVDVMALLNRRNFGIRKAAQNRQSSENAPDKGGFGLKRVIFGHQAKENSPFLRVGKQLVAAREALRRPGSQPANG
ncbi:hypothetical protein [Caballeronia sordidicola]|jgi:hypothetical protein|uniref:Uncharacterized protein n=1 Tax=Caballeronia sordidicola TaxID=196367 RepID=A0A242M6Q1_CABSO|nr:hypothetical protein [Caballeronia sordidicola]OTP66774.1 hypothetical protein PAMC26510_33600 [Caballeronia sordidicola]